MTDTSYGIKDGYQHGTVNLTIEKDAGEYFTPSRIKAFRNNQVHPYLEAAKLMRRRG